MNSFFSAMFTCKQPLTRRPRGAAGGKRGGRGGWGMRRGSWRLMDGGEHSPAPGMEPPGELSARAVLWGHPRTPGSQTLWGAQALKLAPRPLPVTEQLPGSGSHRFPVYPQH